MVRHGFKLTGYKGHFEFYCENNLEQDEWIEKIRRVAISFNISCRYSFGQLLGKGSFAKV